MHFYPGLFFTLHSFLLHFQNMFAARRIAASVAPRIATTSFARPAAVLPTATKAFSASRFLSTNVFEQKRATVQRN